MGRYTFYQEYDGRKTTSGGYIQGEGPVIAKNISQAAKKFAKKKRLRIDNYDSLVDKGYRIFYGKNKWFGKRRELIYYVEYEEIE